MTVKKIHKIFSFFCLLLIFPISLPGEIKPEQIDRIFFRWNNTDSPGCALAIIQNGRIIFQKGYGMANLELNVPIAPASVFYSGSVSKQFVAFCIALLYQEGKLDIKDNIQKYLPEFPDYGSPITIENLIYHTSGIRDYLSMESIAGIPIGNYHEEDVLKLITAQKELNFLPGERYLYSNSGYFLLAVIVKRASGKSLRQYAHAKIFQPLGMFSSNFHDDYRRLIKNRASGYFPSGKDQYTNFLSTFDCVGSGGLFSSVEDLYLWDQNFYHNKVGGKELFKLMHATGTLNSGEKINYAFAIQVGSYKGFKSVSHGGALGGYRAGYLQFPEQNFSVICLANLSSINAMDLCQQVADIFLEKQIKQNSSPISQAEEKTPSRISLTPSELQAYAGNYLEKYTWRRLTLRAEQGELIGKILNQTITLIPVKKTEFFLEEEGSGTQIKFITSSGKESRQLQVVRRGFTNSVYERTHPEIPSPEELKDYTGHYFSKELDSDLQLVIKRKRLCLADKGPAHAFLLPVTREVFIFQGSRIVFQRDKEQNITGLRFSSPRAWNILFTRTRPLE